MKSDKASSRERKRRKARIEQKEKTKERRKTRKRRRALRFSGSLIAFHVFFFTSRLHFTGCIVIYVYFRYSMHRIEIAFLTRHLLEQHFLLYPIHLSDIFVAPIRSKAYFIGFCLHNIALYQSRFQYCQQCAMCIPLLFIRIAK